MAKYTDEAQAQADGFSIEHEADRHRFVVVQTADGGDDAAEGSIVGEAHYTLIGDDAIDFDHTVVDAPAGEGYGVYVFRDL